MQPTIFLKPHVVVFRISHEKFIYFRSKSGTFWPAYASSCLCYQEHAAQTTADCQSPWDQQNGAVDYEPVFRQRYGGKLFTYDVGMVIFFCIFQLWDAVRNEARYIQQLQIQQQMQIRQQMMNNYLM